ncbi:MAG: DNA polymerase III subunit gamma/tau [Oscillospiraceae bacterium]|nr:DNA polymerase III subunit gamma/tau [Oscillospiraceae bacterium]MBQ9908101.1 DNA polymerase III subunit gamma/tau [Oscillospiraceae bacterium]
MAAYEALYRKWRPQTFEDIVAQPHITRTLKNQIMHEKTAHAYLFTGSRGTGKTTCARIFAKAVNCLNPKDGNPCLECEICRDAEAGTLTDIIEIDGASNNGVEEVRSLRENAVYLPVRCKYKVYVIDEVHMMSPGAFNALLKIIEEPPEYVKFVFATTEIHKVPATILSRCQRFDFRRILPADIAGRIQYISEHESFGISGAAAHRIAMLSDGGMRDALSLLDQCAGISDDIDTATVEEAVGVAGTESVYVILRAIASKNAADALERIDLLYQQSKDMTRFADEISQQLRSIMLLKTAPKDPSLVDVMPDELAQLQEISAMYTLPAVLEALSAVRQCCDRMTRAGNRRMELEMTLIRLCTDYQQQTGELKALNNRIAALEQQLQALRQNGIPAAMPLPQPPPKKPAASGNIPAQNLQMEGKPDAKQFLPLKNWAAVLERFYDLAPTIAGLLENSNAYTYEEKGLLLIMVRNSLFKRLFRQQDSEMLLDAAEQVLGKRYQLRYKAIEGESEQTNAPADMLLQRAREQGIRTGEQENSSV